MSSIGSIYFLVRPATDAANPLFMTNFAGCPEAVLAPMFSATVSSFLYQIAAQDIDLVSDKFQMPWIDAPMIATKMISDQSIWNVTSMRQPGGAMGTGGPAFAIDSESKHAIAIPVHRSGPTPAVTILNDRVSNFDQPNERLMTSEDTLNHVRSPSQIGPRPGAVRAVARVLTYKDI